MSNPFVVIEKKPVNEMSLLSSTVLEDDHPVYSPTTTYAKGARVILTTGYHLIYESLVDNNLNSFPASSPDKWVEVGPTNKWAMFDDSIESATTAFETFSFTVSVGRVNAISLLGLNAGTIRVQVFSPGLNRSLYDETFSGNNRSGVTTWSKYFFNPISKKTVLTLLNIPSTVDAQVTVTLVGVGMVSIGLFAAGVTFEVGRTQYGARPGFIDFSRKETDQFGKTKLIKRSFSKRMDVNVFVEAARVDAIQQKLEELRATPAVWVGANGLYDSLTVYGFLRDSGMSIEYPSFSILALQIEGLA